MGPDICQLESGKFRFLIVMSARLFASPPEELVSNSSRKSGGLLLLAVIAIFVIVFLRPRGDIESLVPVVRENRISLLEDLDRVRPESGFPGDSARWLFVRQNPYINRAEGGVGVYAPPTGSMLWEGLSVWPEAKLRFRVSVDPMGVFPESLSDPYAYRFQVEVRAQDASKIVFDQVLETQSPRGIQSDSFEIDLQEFQGGVVDIAFSTESLTPIDPEKFPELLPCWREPLIESKGTMARVGETRLAANWISHDLIADFQKSLKQSQVSEVCVSVESGQDPETVAPIRLETEFDTGAALHIPHGGAQPSVVFAADGEIEYFIEEDIEQGAVLRFGAGQRDWVQASGRALALGGGRVRLLIDDEEVLKIQLPQGTQGWQEVQCGLDDYVGRPIGIRWEIRFDDSSPVTLIQPNPADPKRTVNREVRVREIALSRPRISAPQSRMRRLSSAERPNVILIVAETLRADHLGCYNQDVSWTPHLDALASRGLRYESAISTSSWTWPSTASILTGLYPESHGVLNEQQSFLLDALTSLPEILQLQGVSTSAFVTNGLISPRRNFNQGFETFVLAEYANANQVDSLAKNWLAQYRDLQHFVYMHYFEPHDPCEAPEPFRQKHVPDTLRDRDFLMVSDRVKAALAQDEVVAQEDRQVLLGAYRGEIEYLDQQVGQLMSWLQQEGLDEKTYIVFTADHGEEFWDHDNYGHGSFLYQESIHVPLLVVGPGIEPGTVLSSPVENRWLFRSVLEWMGAGASTSVPCPPLPKVPPSEPPLVVASTAKGILNRADVLSGDPARIRRGLGTFLALRKGPWKLIGQHQDDPDQPFVPRELYHLEDDPTEERNRLDEEPALVERLVGMGVSWLKEVEEVAVRNPTGKASAATQAILKGLGYQK